MSEQEQDKIRITLEQLDEAARASAREYRELQQSFTSITSNLLKEEAKKEQYADPASREMSRYYFTLLQIYDLTIRPATIGLMPSGFVKYLLDRMNNKDSSESEQFPAFEGTIDVSATSDTGRLEQSRKVDNYDVHCKVSSGSSDNTKYTIQRLGRFLVGYDSEHYLLESHTFSNDPNSGRVVLHGFVNDRFDVIQLVVEGIDGNDIVLKSCKSISLDSDTALSEFGNCYARWTGSSLQKDSTNKGVRDLWNEYKSYYKNVTKAVSSVFTGLIEDDVQKELFETAVSGYSSALWKEVSKHLLLKRGIVMTEADPLKFNASYGRIVAAIGVGKMESSLMSRDALESVGEYLRKLADREYFPKATFKCLRDITLREEQRKLFRKAYEIMRGVDDELAGLSANSQERKHSLELGIGHYIDSIAFDAIASEFMTEEVTTKLGKGIPLIEIRKAEEVVNRYLKENGSSLSTEKLEFDKRITEGLSEEQIILRKMMIVVCEHGKETGRGAAELVSRKLIQSLDEAVYRSLIKERADFSRERAKQLLGEEIFEKLEEARAFLFGTRKSSIKALEDETLRQNPEGWFYSLRKAYDEALVGLRRAERDKQILANQELAEQQLSYDDGKGGTSITSTGTISPEQERLLLDNLAETLEQVYNTFGKDTKEYETSYQKIEKISELAQNGDIEEAWKELGQLKKELDQLREQKGLGTKGNQEDDYTLHVSYENIQERREQAENNQNGRSRGSRGKRGKSKNEDEVTD